MTKAFTLNTAEIGTVEHIIDFLCENRIPRKVWLLQKVGKFVKQWITNFFLN